MITKKRIENLFLVCLLGVAVVSCVTDKIPCMETGTQKPMPEAWIDKDTEHKIVKLISGEGDNRSFYFHNNPFLPAGKGENNKMIFYKSVNQERQLYSIDLKTSETEQITNKKWVNGEIVGKNRREVFYQCRDSVFATGIENHQTRLIYVFPDSLRGSISSLNADESLLAGAIVSAEEMELFRKNPEKRNYFDIIYEAKLRRSLFTLSVETGEMKIIYSENAWLNHIQFSPADPDLLMFCHEGPWHKVDRIWTIDINEKIPRLMHKRTMDWEIAGHEFFSPDGNTIWFDLQIPRSKTFYLAGVDVKTGREVKYQLTRNEWSIHFNSSPDQRLFAGDGGDPGQVAKADDGMWIYLFYPDGDSLKSERLVNMKHHDYQLEPNIHFSPDGKWVIFRSNFEGNSNIYAVETRKTHCSDN